MNKKKLKKNIQNNLKILKSLPENIIDETKDKIGNFIKLLRKIEKEN